jgi:hypothetical protein
MLKAEIRDNLEKQVRPILERYNSRIDQVDAKRLRSAMGPLLEQLRNDTPPAQLDWTRACVKSDVELWLLNVGVALAYIGPVAAYVINARLTRRAKSAERSWETLETELFKKAPEMGAEIPSIPDMKQQFTWGLPILAHVLDELRITTEYRTQHAA